ncbi:MAG: hypothetical protein K0S09_36 [Sphingobacteriaceae bacterium]|jgi:hypothetical protein|nr:hypothetical protein [Sphingobacteriaceae bacterium]
MTNAELQKALISFPEDMEIRLGTWYRPVADVSKTDVSINFQSLTCISLLSDEDVDE